MDLFTCNGEFRDLDETVGLMIGMLSGISMSILYYLMMIPDRSGMTHGLRMVIESASWLG